MGDTSVRAHGPGWTPCWTRNRAAPTPAPQFTPNPCNGDTASPTAVGAVPSACRPTDCPLSAGLLGSAYPKLAIPLAPTIAAPNGANPFGSSHTTPYGGSAIGAIAQGGLAVGWLARGAAAKGVHTWGQGSPPTDETRALFDQFAWLVGPAGPMPQIHYGLLATVVIAIVIALLAALPALVASDRADRVEEELRRTPQD